ncbi:MAG: hypothetical protein IT457_19560 [Planctomycetes bacterium]|nr:hypothetical protein [Planctomycetota bacterium]
MSLFRVPSPNPGRALRHSASRRAAPILAALTLLCAPNQAQGPVSAFGFPHVPLGNATLQWNASQRELSVAGIGSSGHDGVECILGNGDGWHGFAHASPLVVPVGGSYTVRAVHLPAGAPEQLVAEMTIRGVDPQRREFSVEIPGHTTATLEGYRGGQLVLRETGLSIDGGTDLELLFYGEYDCTSVWVVRTNAGQIECGTDDLTETEIHVTGGGSAVVDHVRIVPEGLATPLPSIDRIRILGRNLPTLRMQQASVQLDGVECNALGRARLAPVNGGLDVPGIGSSMLDGVEFRSFHDSSTGQRSLREGARITLDALEVSGPPLPLGAALRMSGTGTMPGTAEIPLGHVTITKLATQVLELQADYAAVGMNTQRIELLADGDLIASIPGHSGPIARFAQWPNGCGKERIWDGSGTSCFAFGWDQPVHVQILGAGAGTWQADEIRVLAEGPGSLSEIRSLALTGAGLGHLVVLGVTEKGAASAIAYGTGCGGLALSASPPVLGATCTAQLDGIPAGSPAAVAMLGLAQSPGLPLEFLGMAGCELLVMPLDALGAPVLGAGLTMQFAIPDDPRLVGAELALQFLTVSPGANPFGMLASNGVRLRFDR